MRSEDNGNDRADHGNFDEITSREGITLIDFWASWCGPCLRFAPIYDRVSEKHPDITFGKVDTEDQQELAARYDIRSIPTIMAIRDGVIVFAQPGPARGRGRGADPPGARAGHGRGQGHRSTRHDAIRLDRLRAPTKTDWPKLGLRPCSARRAPESPSGRRRGAGRRFWAVGAAAAHHEPAEQPTGLT
jgi:thioredoxin